MIPADVLLWPSGQADVISKLFTSPELALITLMHNTHLIF